jgi:hypothetical protein
MYERGEAKVALSGRRVTHEPIGAVRGRDRLAVPTVNLVDRIGAFVVDRRQGCVHFFFYRATTKGTKTGL